MIDFTFGQWEKVEPRPPSLDTVYGLKPHAKLFSFRL